MKSDKPSVFNSAALKNARLLRFGDASQMDMAGMLGMPQSPCHVYEAIHLEDVNKLVKSASKWRSVICAIYSTSLFQRYIPNSRTKRLPLYPKRVLIFFEFAIKVIDIVVLLWYSNVIVK